MRQFRVTDRAKADLSEIWAYIAEDNESAADRLVASLEDKYRLLAQRPRLGRTREEFGAGLRSLSIGSHLIF